MSVRNLKLERESRGWSLEYTGKHIGISKQSLSALENGYTDPSYKVLCKIEKLFHPKKHGYLFGAATPDNAKEPDGNQADMDQQ